MKNRKNNYLIYLIIVISAIIIALLCYLFLSDNNKEPENEVVFKFNETNIDLKIGETKKIDYTLSDATLNIEWISSNSIINVNSNGEINTNSYGTSTITGIVKYDGKTITDTCKVTSYTGNIGVKLESVNIDDGYILMKPNSEMNIPWSIVPENAYITSIEYIVNDQNIAEIKDNKIISKKTGYTYLRATFNNDIYFDKDIKVSESVKDNKLAKDIKEVSFKETSLIMEIGDSKKLDYSIVPSDGYIEDIKWISSNENIVKVNNGDIKAINMGEATIKVLINNNVESSIKVQIKSTNSDIFIDNNPKTLLRIGKTTTIKAHIEPKKVNDAIIYKSSNSAVVRVDNGVITGISSGTATITLSISNGKTKSFTINVLPDSGLINGSANFWGYKSLNATTPVLADTNFFKALAQNGIGVMQGNNYLISTSEASFTYDTTGNLLSVAGKKIKLRVYYPTGKALSELNTTVYMGGRGETNFSGAFNDIYKDPSKIKSGGIVALIAEGNGTSFDGDSGAYVTKFLKAFTKQNSNAYNSILGFSDGAHKVLHAAKKENYKTIVIFSGYTDGASSINNAKDKEIIFMIASNDGNYSQAKTAMNEMKNSGYKSVTFVTNGTDLSRYENTYLHINPGNLMKKGHLTENVLLSGIIEYLND